MNQLLLESSDNTLLLWIQDCTAQYLLRAIVIVLVFLALPSGHTQEAHPNISANIEFDEEWDWVQLTSGEWLKGELLGMEKDTLDFDSDNMGEISFDWDDIQALYTTAVMEVFLDTLEIRVGRLETREGQLRIVAAQVDVDFDSVLRIATGSQSEWDLWRGKISAGMDLDKGNVDQEDINIAADLLRRTSKSSFRVTYVSSYSRNQGVKTTDQQRINVNYDYRLSERWFWQPIVFEYYRDPFQNIDAQVTAGTGFGAYLIENDTTNWTVAAGPGYQRIRYVETPAGSDRETTSPAFYLFTQYDLEVTSDIDLTASYRVTITDEDAGRAKHHTAVSFYIDLTDSLDLNISAYWDHIAEPQADDGGIVPLKDDYRYVVGISYEI